MDKAFSLLYCYIGLYSFSSALHCYPCLVSTSLTEHSANSTSVTAVHSVAGYSIPYSHHVDYNINFQYNLSTAVLHLTLARCMLHAYELKLKGIPPFFHNISNHLHVCGGAQNITNHYRVPPLPITAGRWAVVLCAFFGYLFIH